MNDWIAKEATKTTCVYCIIFDTFKNSNNCCVQEMYHAWLSDCDVMLNNLFKMQQYI